MPCVLSQLVAQPDQQKRPQREPVQRRPEGLRPRRLSKQEEAQTRLQQLLPNPLPGAVIRFEEGLERFAGPEDEDSLRAAVADADGTVAVLRLERKLVDHLDRLLAQGRLQCQDVLVGAVHGRRGEHGQ